MTSFKLDAALIVKPYEVSVLGFRPVVRYASSPGLAFSQAWREYCASTECSFTDFMKIARVGRCEQLPEGYGEPILVAGELAYRIPRAHNGQYVAYVCPHSDQIYNAHPNDVTYAPAREAPAPDGECAP